MAAIGRALLVESDDAGRSYSAASSVKAICEWFAAAALSKSVRGAVAKTARAVVSNSMQNTIGSLIRKSREIFTD